jgi:hypothetical protein
MGDNLMSARLIDGDDLPGNPIGAPDAAIVPPWGLGESKSGQQDVHLGH